MNLVVQKVLLFWLKFFLSSNESIVLDDLKFMSTYQPYVQISGEKLHIFITQFVESIFVGMSKAVILQRKLKRPSEIPQ